MTSRLLVFAYSFVISAMVTMPPQQVPTFGQFQIQKRTIPDQQQPIPYRTTSLLSDETNFLSAEDSFHFDVSCGTMSHEICDKAKEALNRAGTRIADQIWLRRQIRVQVTFLPRIPNRLKSEGKPTKYYSNNF